MTRLEHPRRDYWVELLELFRAHPSVEEQAKQRQKIVVRLLLILRILKRILRASQVLK